MILLEIQNIQKFKPVKWESKDLSGLSEGQTYIRFAGHHPGNPEYGSVVLSVEMLEGSFNKIDQVLFIGGGTLAGRLLNWEKKLSGGYEIEIHLDGIFGHGLEYSAQHFIHKGGAIIGMSEGAEDSLNTISGQKELLSLLAEHVIPSKKSEILSFARPAYLLMPNEDSNENVSHFQGSPKHAKAAMTDEKGHQLFHLATLNLREFSNIETFGKMNNVLSFYLRTRETGKSWPQNKHDFKIFNYENFINTDATEDFFKACNFDIINLLDLPGWNHSLLQVLNFSAEERKRYDALRSTYMHLLLGERVDFDEVNKLFGFPDSIQNCVAYEAERVFHQREYSDEINKDAVHWTLLLQVSPYCKWLEFFDDFGDGSIYYMIRNEDLERGNFENCQVIVQNT